MIDINKIYELEDFCDEQLMKSCDGLDGLAYFVFEEEGIAIVNPFRDCCDWSNVDPIKEYGEESIISFLEQYENLTTNQIKQTEV